jgi:hypothetical protein
MTLPGSCAPALISAFCSEWMQPQLPG